MIRPIDIKLNAAHPELPLVEATTFTGAPSSVFIRGVPKSVGNWSITAVNVAVTYPDNSTTTRAAVESAEGVWVATIPGTATSGRTVAGFRILADGIDENSAAVTGYVLGFADFAVLSFFPVPAPGETFFYLRYFDTMPTAAKKMDVTTIDGILKYYNGTTWLPFAAYDNTVTRTSANGVKSSGIWSAIWGALSALPTGFSSLYDWCVAQLAGKADKSVVDPLLFAQYYPDGSVKSTAEFTQGIKYDDPDIMSRTIMVKPFCNTGAPDYDNSSLVDRVVIPPFVDAQGNGYISDDGTRYKVVGVSGDSANDENTNLTAIVAPNTVTTIGEGAFFICTALTTVSLPAATSIGIGVFANCTSLASVDFGDTPRSSVPTLGTYAFNGVPSTCKIVVPYTQYDAWIAAENWRDLQQEFVRHPEKADKPATFTTGNLAALDLDGNPVDSGVKASDKLDSTSAAPAFSTDSTVSYPVGSHVTYNGKLYVCTTATTGGTWVAGSWTEDTVAMKAPNPTAGNLAALDANGNPTDSMIPAANVATKGEIPYSLGTPIVIDTASSETVEGETVNYGAATLANRTQNQVFVVVALDELRVTIPAAVSGKVRDFGLLVAVGLGEGTALAAPALVPIAPTGETITMMNADGEVPTLADGTTTSTGSTVLYFTEVADSTFLVKGEQIQVVA